MSIFVTRYRKASEFLAAAEAYFLEREALNSLILGVARAQRRRARPPAAYVLVNDERGPLLAGIPSSPHKFVLGWNNPTGDEAIAALVDHLLPTHRHLPSLFGPAELTSRFAARWCAATGHTAAPGLSQRLYKLEEVTFPPSLPEGRLRTATDNDSALLAEWMFAFQVEALPDEVGDRDVAQMIADQLVRNQDLFVWEAGHGDGRVMAMAARARPTVRGIAVNMVYTPPEGRRHGHATACVAYLSQFLLQSGWSFCTLFADRTNATANHIYERLGYAPIADFDEYRFTPA